MNKIKIFTVYLLIVLFAGVTIAAEEGEITKPKAKLRDPAEFQKVIDEYKDYVAKIPAETLQAVLADKAKLTSILTYHVVSGKVMAADVVSLTEAKTVQGGTLKIDASNGVMINDAKVTTADIECSNGVIHVIDTVLMPQ